MLNYIQIAGKRLIAMVFLGCIPLFLLNCCCTIFPQNRVSLEELHDLLDQANRIEVIEDPWMEPKVIFESTDRNDIQELKESIEIKIPPCSYVTVCTCVPDFSIYVYNDNNKLLVLENIEGQILKVSIWESDVDITNTPQWLEWFYKRGIKGPREHYEKYNP